jgi:hypothetical protein
MRIVALTALVACSMSPAAAQSGSAALTAEQWRGDLAYLAKELPSRHKNAFAQVTRADFEKQVADLDSRIPKLSEVEIRMGILKLVASINDSHTTVQSRGRLAPLHTLPIALYWFKDGIFAIAAAEPYRNLLGARLLRIGKMNVEDAWRVLSVLVPHENDAVLKVQLPNNILTKTGLLQTMGIADSSDAVRLELRSPTGERISLEVPAIPPNPPHERVQAFQGEQPLYGKNARRRSTTAPPSTSSTTPASTIRNSPLRTSGQTQRDAEPKRCSASRGRPEAERGR